MKSIPDLPELLPALERAFQHHLEFEFKGRKSALLRMAGHELRLADMDESPDDLAAHLCSNLAEVAAYGLATALTENSPAGTRLRMTFITALAHLEATRDSTRGHARDKHAADGDALVTTADAATQLGMSRPYVSMLCDQGKLGEVHRSEGGHRRIRQSAVDQYKLTHQAP